MVENDIILVAAPDGILAVRLSILDFLVCPRGFVSQAKTDKPDDYIVCPNIGRIVLQADTVARGRLARDRQVALGNLEVGSKTTVRAPDWFTAQRREPFEPVSSSVVT